MFFAIIKDISVKVCIKHSEFGQCMVGQWSVSSHPIIDQLIVSCS